MENNPRASLFNNPADEIAYLRNQIKSKEAELSQKGESNLDDIVKNEISIHRNALSSDLLSPAHIVSSNEVTELVTSLLPERHDRKMEEMVTVLETKGVKNSMSVLSGFNDPNLEDDFHRFLVQYIKQGYSPKDISMSDKQFRGLNMTLYEVVLPEEGQEEKTKSLKETISSMEQFFSGMLSVTAKDSTKTHTENYIVMEIANANGSDQFVFYVAVPNVHKELFERQMISIFHNARLTESTADYNIFNTDGVAMGSYLEASNNAIYPFKTYEAFDHDPLNIILNSFSKIQKTGEGAAIQIVFAPKGDYFNKKYEYAIDKIEKGTPVKEAIYLPESFSGAFTKEVFKLFSAPKSANTEDKKPVDNEAIQRIKQKTSSTIVATNIRLISSAGTKADAERILQSLESSFNQFTDTASNGIRAHRLEKGKLQEMFRSFSFRTYEPSQLLPLNLKEVTSLIHFHTTTLTPQPQLKQTQSISAPAPAEIGTEGILLGKNTFRNVETPIHMKDEDRLRHIYTIGQTGTGKTTFLKNMIIQDIERGAGVCFIDPHGTDVMDILSNVPPSRYQDVIYFDPSYTARPMALNMLEYDPAHPEQKIFVVNELFSIFQKLYGGNPESMGPMFEQYFRNSAMLVLEDPESGCTLLDVSRVMSNKEYRQLKLSRCKNPIVYQFWTEVAEKAGGEASLANIVPYIVSKFDTFLANDVMRPIISQEKSSFNFREIMDGKKILLVNLSKGKLGDINANLIGLILVGKILMAALSRVDLVGTDFPAFYLYIDEFQNITTDSIATILSEARKYKLSLNIAHQFIAQIEQGIRDAVFGNVGSIAAFRVGAEDAEFLEKQFSPVFTAKDIMNIDNYNAYLKMLVSGKTVKAFNIKMEVPKKGNPEVVERLKQLSYLTYGGDREEVEAAILKKYKK